MVGGGQGGREEGERETGRGEGGKGGRGKGGQGGREGGKFRSLKKSQFCLMAER